MTRSFINSSEIYTPPLLATIIHTNSSTCLHSIRDGMMQNYAELCTCVWTIIVTLHYQNINLIQLYIIIFLNYLNVYSQTENGRAGNVNKLQHGISLFLEPIHDCLSNWLATLMIEQHAILHVSGLSICYHYFVLGNILL